MRRPRRGMTSPLYAAAQTRNIASATRRGAKTKYSEAERLYARRRQIQRLRSAYIFMVGRGKSDCQMSFCRRLQQECGGGDRLGSRKEGDF